MFSCSMNHWLLVSAALLLTLLMPLANADAVATVEVDGANVTIDNTVCATAAWRVSLSLGSEGSGPGWSVCFWSTPERNRCKLSRLCSNPSLSDLQTSSLYAKITPAADIQFKAEYNAPYYQQYMKPNLVLLIVSLLLFLFFIFWYVLHPQLLLCCSSVSSIATLFDDKWSARYGQQS